MKVCFDVNIAIDILAERAESFESLVAFDVAKVRGDACLYCAGSVADTAYVLYKNGIRGADLNYAIESLFSLFDLVDVTGEDCENAYRGNMKDIEDAIIAESAKRNGADLIVTRNVRDFANSPVPAVTPAEFTDRYKPPRYDYFEFSAQFD